MLDDDAAAASAPAPAFPRPPTPAGFDPSRASERREDPSGWRFADEVRDALATAIAGRRDIRRFRASPVAEETVRALLQAAHRAPSVGFMQPWRFIVIRSPEIKLAVRELAERERLRQAPRMAERARHFLEQKVEGIRESPVGICVCCDRGDPGDEVLGRSTIRDTDLYSTACAIQNLWLTARAEGLGVGWVSFYKPEDMRRVLGIPDRVEPVAYLCVGYPDERPVRPGLETAGWASRMPLDDVVFQDRWPTGANGAAPVRPAGDRPSRARRRVASPLPAALAELVAAVPPTDQAAAVATRDRSDELVKPVGSLGALEVAVERWSAATGEPPPAPLRALVLVCAADHGVAARGTSLFASPVSAQVTAAAARGETAIGVLSRARGNRLLVADLGLATPTPPGVLDRKVMEGTRDIASGPAMSAEQAMLAISAGASLASESLPDADCLVCGEIGIGNTTAAAALLAALTGQPAERVCGRGTGLDAAGLARKQEVIRQALNANHACTPAVPTPTAPAPTPAAPADDGGAWRDGAFEALRRLGGLEIAAIVGAILASCARRRPVVLDGFTVGVAALVAVRLCPPAREYLIAAHRSSEPAHDIALTELGLEPLLDLRLRLGEGSGAALALDLIEQAGRLHREMGTYASAGVDNVRGG
jgi:nicotinate-nucleotide--dimethylbenzimidazole phosphoribosyltransferase